MSYFVSNREDMRDAYEVVSASSHDHAADIASATVSGSPLYVMHNGDMRVIDIEDYCDPDAEDEAAERECEREESIL